MQILTNQIGYVMKDYKKAVLQSDETVTVNGFRIEDENKRTAFRGKAEQSGAVARWNMGFYWVMDFSQLTDTGVYRICVETPEEEQYSYPFSITAYFQDMRMLNAVSYYFKAQRNSGEWQEADSRLPFQGSREGIVDAHGGWMDATGDYGIHMSHLSHSSVCNPQQAGFSAYVFFKAVENLLKSDNREYSMLLRRMLDEGTYGADYIMRMRAPSGTLFRSKHRGKEALGSVFQARSLQKEHRPKNAEPKPEEDRDYEVSLRSGGGTCIAALAAAARHYYPGTDFNTAEYLLAAKKAFSCLWENNETYCNDGSWNLLDEYCGLLAASELYHSTSEYDYYDKAVQLTERLLERMVDTGDECAWFTSRPGELFCHASDEGLPIVALLTFYEVAPDFELRERMLEMVKKAMNHLLAVTGRVNNPFGYARYRHSLPDNSYSEKFFYYHTNPAAPWWQGDNARIASLATAAWMAARYVQEDLSEALRRFAQDQINWIMGLNPFDSCMIEGYGRNNIQYFFQNRYDFINCPGGICNGVTSRMDDEEGILFVKEPTEEINDNWRWAEQWIPHGSWYIYALAVKQRCS